MKQQNFVADFLEQDTQKLADLIRDYPFQIPLPVIADWFGCSENSLRDAIMQGQCFGFGWLKSGKQNRGFCIPTGRFVRWYLGHSC